MLVKSLKPTFFSAGTVSGYKAIEDDADKIAVSDNGTITLTEKGETNKAYTLTGGKVTYAGVQFPIADFKVMFAESKKLYNSYACWYFYHLW